MNPNEFVFLDGGMGTMLQAAGLPVGMSPMLWNLTAPEKIAAVHKKYIDAGTQIIYTNTFGANRIKLGDEADVGEVVRAAREEAKQYLRARQPFVWNATNLYREVRQGLISLFERYGARSRIVWLETDLQTRRERNAGRPDAVPEKNVEKMLSHMVPPLPDEAHTVTWLCV